MSQNPKSIFYLIVGIGLLFLQSCKPESKEIGKPNIVLILTVWILTKKQLPKSSNQMDTILLPLANGTMAPSLLIIPTTEASMNSMASLQDIGEIISVLCWREMEKWSKVMDLLLTI